MNRELHKEDFSEVVSIELKRRSRVWMWETTGKIKVSEKTPVGYTAEGNWESKKKRRYWRGGYNQLMLGLLGHKRDFSFFS